MNLDSQFDSYFIEVNLLGKKDLHDVVRESLNAAAMETKKKHIPSEAQDKFTVRRRNFFTALTAVNYSKRGQSSDLSGLFSEVGFIKTDSTRNMSVQEWGGKIDREIIPLNAARIGNSYNRLISKRNFFKGNMLKQSQMFGKNAQQRMAVGLYNARKEGHGFFEADEYESIYKLTGDKIKSVYNLDKTRKLDIKPKHLIEDSSNQARKNIQQTFITEAQNKIKFRASKIKW